MGWPDFKLWRRRIVRWESSTDVAVARRADKVMKALGVELQRKLEHLTDDILTSSGGVQAILDYLDVLSGERRGDERRKTARECLLQFQRRPNETLTEFTARLDLQFDKLQFKEWRFQMTGNKCLSKKELPLTIIVLNLCVCSRETRMTTRLPLRRSGNWTSPRGRRWPPAR
eukprot:2081406-Pyramimonas_sp.AAC.1